MKKQLSASTVVVILVIVVIAVVAIGWYATSTKKGAATGVTPDAQQGVQDMMKQKGQMSGQGSGSPSSPAGGGGG